jgi:hypothetical protein
MRDARQSETALDWKMNRWIQRFTLAAMVALALTLLAVGVGMYAPAARAANGMTEAR